MTRTLRLALAAVPLLVVVAGCGADEPGTARPSAKPCGPLPTADPAASLPRGFPAPRQVLFDPATQGKAHIVFGLVDDGDFVRVRDDLVDRLEAAGYTIDGTDQESVEAEAAFSGPHRGTIKVEPLCEGRVTVRYKILG